MRYALVSVPDGSERETVDLPQTSPIAAFISEHEVATTRYHGLTTDSVVAIDVQSGEERQLFEVPGRQITSLTYDAPSDTLLAVAINLDGPTNGVIVTYDAQGVHFGPEIAGLSSGAWYAPTVTAPASTTTSVAPETTTSSVAPTTTTTTTTASFTGSTLPPPTGVAGFTDYRTVGLETLEAAYLADAASPQAKVDELVAFLRDEPIEGRKGAEGAVTSIAGESRAQVEVRVLGRRQRQPRRVRLPALPVAGDARRAMEGRRRRAAGPVQSRVRRIGVRVGRDRVRATVRG